MNKIKVLIVDDEPIAHDILQSYCEKIDGLEVVGHCFDGISTLNFLNKTKVDVILLDIQMPDITGVELLDTLKQNAPKIIFTTAYTDYAVQSFNYDQVVDYLHKPIRITRFIKAIERLKKILNLEGDYDKVIPEEAVVKSTPNEVDYINLKDNKTVYRIPFDEILYIQSWGNYLKFFLVSQEVKIIRKTIKNLEEELPTHAFQRIHKSYIVNLKKVKALEGHQIVILDQKLPIGKSYLLVVKKLMKG